jgi:hypothetical protein
MSKNVMDNLFGSRVRVKVLKFLFRNFPDDFDIARLAKRTQEPNLIIKKEIIDLKSMGLIRRKTTGRYAVNQDFEFFQELKALILKPSPAEKNSMAKKISRLGRIRLAIISGIFLNDTNTVESFNSLADLFIVGDDIDKDRLRMFLRALEAEVGAELKFTLMAPEEFQYRHGMFDRFVRVLLEGPHEKIINRLGI